MSDSTRRTLRTAFAALVALAAALPVLVREAGLDPARWPWLVTVLAVAALVTRVMASPSVEAFLGAYLPWLAKDKAPGRHEAPPDAGIMRVVAACTLAALTVGLLVVAVLVVTSPAHARARAARVVAPAVTSAETCGTALVVHFDTSVLAGRQWQPLQDDGHAVLELLERSGRSGADGVWETPPAEWGAVVSGGEHVLRWAGWRTAAGYGLHFQKARVLAGGYRSMPAQIEDGCAA